MFVPQSQSNEPVESFENGDDEKAKGDNDELEG
jgi:hypothetical protein